MKKILNNIRTILQSIFAVTSGYWKETLTPVIRNLTVFLWEVPIRGIICDFQILSEKIFKVLIKYLACLFDRKKVVKIALYLVLAILLFSFMVFAINRRVTAFGKKYSTTAAEAPQAQTAIVLGALVISEGVPCDMLYDRIKTAVELYKAGKVQKLLMTGDHGREDYDEVNTMRLIAIKEGVPSEDIFMDHAGFSTYESMARAKKIFRIESAIVVTQQFHLTRSVYIARKMGLEATGVPADRRTYLAYYLKPSQAREIPARVKDFCFVNFLKPNPSYKGKPIPITGSATLTHDRNTAFMDAKWKQKAGL